MNTEFCFSHTEVKMTSRYLGGDIKKKSRNMSQGAVRKEIRTWKSPQHADGISSQSTG